MLVVESVFTWDIESFVDNIGIKNTTTLVISCCSLYF